MKFPASVHSLAGMTLKNAVFSKATPYTLVSRCHCILWNGSRWFLRNISTYLWNYVASYPKGQ
jgi:hypothetical protein